MSKLIKNDCLIRYPVSGVEHVIQVGAGVRSVSEIPNTLGSVCFVGVSKVIIYPVIYVYHSHMTSMEL